MIPKPYIEPKQLQYGLYLINIKLDLLRKKEYI